MEDKLIVSGVHENLDGEYPCDILGMLTVGHDECLTNRELHIVKKMTELTAVQLFEGIQSGDMDATLGLAAIILRRANKVYQEDWLWDAPMGSSLTFDIKDREEEQVPPPEDAP